MLIIHSATFLISIDWNVKIAIIFYLEFIYCCIFNFLTICFSTASVIVTWWASCLIYWLFHGEWVSMLFLAEIDATAVAFFSMRYLSPRWSIIFINLNWPSMQVCNLANQYFNFIIILLQWLFVLVVLLFLICSI